MPESRHGGEVQSRSVDGSVGVEDVPDDDEGLLEQATVDEDVLALEHDVEHVPVADLAPPLPELALDLDAGLRPVDHEPAGEPADPQGVPLRPGRRAGVLLLALAAVGPEDLDALETGPLQHRLGRFARDCPVSSGSQSTHVIWAHRSSPSPGLGMSVGTELVQICINLSTKPSLLLLDEPLSNLDAALRERTRVELKRFHDKWGITMVYVTHDQIEAISLANRIAVMRLGRVEQYDFADVIYKQPASIFVAQFIGNPPSNIVNGEIAQVDGRYYFQNHNLRVDISKHRTAIERHTKGSRIALGFRPEDVLITKTKPSKNDIGSEVFNIELLGYETILDLKIGEIGIKALVSSDFITSVGETVYWGLPIEKLNLYDSVTGENMIYTRA